MVRSVCLRKSYAKADTNFFSSSDPRLFPGPNSDADPDPGSTKLVPKKPKFTIIGQVFEENTLNFEVIFS
jgi:hypothetical protein